MNILISCCGTRNKIVRYFMHEIPNNGKVIATDSSNLAPALYDASLAFTVPMIDEDEYLYEMLSLCKEQKVEAILPLLDPELVFLAKHRQAFIDVGTVPILSNREAIETSYDKYKMNTFLRENGFSSMKTYSNIADFQNDKDKKLIDFPVFIKPRSGSGSQNVRRVNSTEELRFLLGERSDLIIQEYISGTEYGADVYVDMITNYTNTVFLREKIRMRAGETDKAVSVHDEALTHILEELISKMDLIGPLDFDVIKTNNTYYVIDVNPRFGGEYPMAHSQGINFPKMIIENLQGRKNPKIKSKYKEGIFFLRYYEDMTIENVLEPWGNI